MKKKAKYCGYAKDEGIDFADDLSFYHLVF